MCGKGSGAGENAIGERLARLDQTFGPRCSGQARMLSGGVSDSENGILPVIRPGGGAAGRAPSLGSMWGGGGLIKLFESLATGEAWTDALRWKPNTLGISSEPTERAHAAFQQSPFPTRTVPTKHRLGDFIVGPSGDTVPETGSRNERFRKARKMEMIRAHNFFVGQDARLEADFQMAGRKDKIWLIAMLDAHG